MEAHQILQARFLDILFEGKNKLYGAYDLRKTYNERIAKAMLATLLFMLVLVLSFIISKRFTKDKLLVRGTSTVLVLKKIAPEKPKTIPRLRTPVHVATVKVSTPEIVKDHLVTTPPPDVHEIENAVIGLKTIDGPKPDPGVVNPPISIEGTNVVAKPVKKGSDDNGFMPVEKEASFPGGAQAWQKYIEKAIQRQLDELTDADYGTCIVKFRVDEKGNVSNVAATTMQGTKLAEIAINTIKKGPQWIPAMQNGHYVTADRLQPVTLLNPNQ